ncbi:MAG: site-2 protease family protein [Candidatus Krumholzibacteria bacterium]|nr:site-2 protease family protein [Candidatus Krumholzibacteria bacterium]
MVIQVLVLVFSVVVHEVAHGYTAWKLGDNTAHDAGRLTLNPLPHIDPVGSILVPLVLAVTGSGFMFGWARPVPVNPGRLNNPMNDHSKVAAAGPISNLLLALVFAVLLGLVIAIGGFPVSVPGGHPEPSLHSFLFTMFQFGVVINVVLAVFNLLPLPPLDGSWILSRFLPREARANYENLRRYGMMIVIGFLMLVRYTPVGSLFSTAIYTVINPFFRLAETVAHLGGA